MSVRQHVDAKTLGKRYAELVRERDLPVQGIWVRNTAKHPEIWVVTQPLELKQLRPIYEARVSLRSSFPDAEYEFNILNPQWIPHFSQAEQLPADCNKIELRG